MRRRGKQRKEKESNVKDGKGRRQLIKEKKRYEKAFTLKPLQTSHGTSNGSSNASLRDDSRTPSTSPSTPSLNLIFVWRQVFASLTPINFNL